MNARTFSLVASLCLPLLTACAHYTTPGAPASIPKLIDSDIAEAMARQPAATFPAHLVVARVQGPDYRSASNFGYGEGRYTVVTTRDIETEADFARLNAMQGIAGVGVLNRLLLPTELHSTKELRTAAAQLRADIVLVYTMDTSFRTEGKTFDPLQVVALGLFRNRKAHVNVTCAAAFVDVRTGFVYGVAEASAKGEQTTDLWNTREAIERARMKAEREAFTGALGEIEKTWAGIYREHARSAVAGSR